KHAGDAAKEASDTGRALRLHLLLSLPAIELQPVLLVKRRAHAGVTLHGAGIALRNDAGGCQCLRIGSLVAGEGGTARRNAASSTRRRAGRQSAAEVHDVGLERQALVAN